MLNALIAACMLPHMLAAVLLPGLCSNRDMMLCSDGAACSQGMSDLLEASCAMVRACCWCSYFYIKSYAEGSGVIHLAAGIV